MQLIVNGKLKEFPQKSTLADVIKALDLEGKVMAAAVNMEIVKQERWHERILNEGDKLELLDFVGGG